MHGLCQAWQFTTHTHTVTNENYSKHTRSTWERSWNVNFILLHMEMAKGCYFALRGKIFYQRSDPEWETCSLTLKNGGNRNILKSNLLWNVSLSLPSPSLLPFLSLPSAGNMFCRAPFQQFCDRNSITLVTRPAKLNKQRWGIWQCGSLLFCLQRKSIFFYLHGSYESWGPEQSQGRTEINQHLTGWTEAKNVSDNFVLKLLL